MTVFLHSIAEWKTMKANRHCGQTIGMVATMGNLHQGHLSLCSQSAKENDLTVVSIYVNPKQFNDPIDFANYPRTLAADRQMLEAHGGVDYCLILSDEEIYPVVDHYQVQESRLSELMEGRYRPGHFSGVLTIVLKLLLGIGPKRAYFGEKDYQQFLLIKNMQEALFLDCEIIACPIIRESSGLPFSSRNRLLSTEERQLADEFAILFLQKASSSSAIQQNLEELGMGVDYCEEHFGRRFAAVRIGRIRLLDNYALEH